MKKHLFTFFVSGVNDVSKSNRWVVHFGEAYRVQLIQYVL